MLIEFLVIFISDKEIHQIAITLYKQKNENIFFFKNPKYFSEKKILKFLIIHFSSKRPETESRNSRDHKL